MNSKVLCATHLTFDKFLRFRNKARRFFRRKSAHNTQASDSEASFYVASLERIINSEKKHNFRRNFDYREVLEHVDFQTGNLYLNRMQSLGFDVNKLIQIGLPNDSYGNPRTYKYTKTLSVSPTTLRYLATACEMVTLFDSLDDARVVEIGAGYGGQFAILSRMFKLKSYSIYDLPQAQKLTEYFLRETKVSLSPRMLDINKIESSSFDLVISNYAFSELPKLIQKNYLDLILANSSKGYLIMNTGKSNETGRSNGKLELSDISNVLPHSRVLPEIPLTSPDNYVLTWG